MTKLRLGVEAEGKKQINLRALFAAFDMPWDERSQEVFERTMARLEERDKRSDGWE